MKKIALYMSLALAGLFTTACNEDFGDWAAPQTNGAENAITIPGFTASAVAAQNLATAGDEVPMFTLNMPALPDGYQVANARVELTPQGIDEPSMTLINTTVDGKGPKETLQELIVSTYGKRPDVRTFSARVLVNAVKDGQAVFIDAGNVEVNIAPEAPHIAPAYYVVGGTKDWAGSAASKEQKFSHSDQDVYDDPIFTIVIDAVADGDTWFAIGDDEACDAIGQNDWSKLLGIVGGENKATTGSLDYRYNMGADNSFCVPAGSKKIKITIDMMEYTFSVQPVNISDNYYLIGGPGDWSADAALTMPFSHSDKDVFDDPVFTYVFEGSGSDMWFAFGDTDAINAVAAGDWNQLFGTTGASEDLSGTFDRRNNFDGDHSFHIDGKAKYYRFSVNMAEMTYEITPLNFTEYIYEAGVNNEWGSIEQPLYCANQDGVYTGFFYAQDADWSGGMGAFKFQGSYNSWDNGNYGAGTCSDTGGTMVNDGSSGNLLATPGFYRADVDLANMTYTLTRINSIFVVGSAVNNDWDNGVEMTYNLGERCWECIATLNEGQIKFKGNGTWDNQDGNWGGSLQNVVNGSNDNIDVPVIGKVQIKFFPRCDTKSYATITAVD